MKKWGNCRKQFVFVARSCVCFQISGVHSKMSAKSAKKKSE